MNLFLSPNGRINQGTYWRGVIILMVITLLLSVLSAYVSPFLSFAAIIVVWPWIAIHVKRFHDADMSGWITVAVVVASFVLSFVFGLFLPGMFGVDQAAMQAEVNEIAASGDIGAVMEYTKEMTKLALPATIIQSVLTTALIGLGMGFLKSDPNENKYGPPTA